MTPPSPSSATRSSAPSPVRSGTKLAQTPLDLSEPDGYVALVGADRFGMASHGEDRGVGDVSGDGRDDVAVSADMSPEAGRDAVYLIDTPPSGGREVEEFPTLDHSTQEPPEANGINPVLVGDPGDWNGVGRADLVLFQSWTEHKGDPARAWLVAGPVTGDVDLATDATPLTLSPARRADLGTTAAPPPPSRSAKAPILPSRNVPSMRYGHSWSTSASVRVVVYGAVNSSRVGPCQRSISSKPSPSKSAARRLSQPQSASSSSRNAGSTVDRSSGPCSSGMTTQDVVGSR